MPKIIATHDGTFHADDICAVATLRLTLAGAETVRVVRTRDQQMIEKADFAVDVGGVYDADTNRFDHHQAGGAGKRGNTVPYAAFGLVWKKFGETLCGDAEIASRVEDTLVVPIDANDNGVSLSLPTTQSLFSYEISDAIRAFVPTWQENQDTLEASFNEAVSFAKRIIEREIKRAEAVVAGKREVEKHYAGATDKRLIVLPEDYSWKDTLAKFPGPLYVVHPQGDSWRLYCVRDNPHLFVNRKDLPKSWAGLRDEELVKVTGVPDAVFCHRNRFMAVAKTREAVMALAQKALMS